MTDHDRPGRPRPVERLAAFIALAALPVAMTTLIVGAVMNWEATVAAVAALLVGVTAGWHAVSRKGMRRALAGLGAALALALLVAVGFLTDLSLPRLALVLVLAALSAAAARVALHRRGGSVEAAGGPAAKPARPVLLMNPKSGGGKVERFGLVDECSRRGIGAVLLKPGEDLRELAEQAIARGADAIGMAGGDGSQAIVAEVAARHDIPHIVVPTGTRNHLALDLGLDRDDVVGALDAFVDGVERRIDLATVNGRVFVNNASLGLYARVVQSPQYRDAKLKTAAETLPDLLGPDAVPPDLRFTGPDGAPYPTAQLILVSNGPYQLDRLEGRGTRERMDSGRLGVVTLTIRDTAEAVRFTTLQAAGQVRRFPGWRQWTAERFDVRSGAPVAIGVDGEALTLEAPIVFATLPGALRLRLPRHAVGISPAGRAVHLLSRSTVAALAAVCLGRPADGHNTAGA
ncbi:NAD(+)/NADH kinase [Streptomyces lunaelactis]|uniref:diacylglycerol/lipid kinase family protein n=1 Tax=Streptomyces lunaelactis TaxID=1535768 RepID=UPI00158571F8|nr:diacylglycerol kinase family protein [Streptomyces lunaelactis]NUK32407.1 NAD(+)/NADH kinase [Streptomyces lunaelactis]NUK39424.1 NAD(+)/NADH kinase [Streptomyces lunaelactis]NUK93542.1 NAD(+)/NADH kinase [Streptomyces lunaelactis]NUL28383.1 NAD(+)/NADH kinase [Streptomyces lunaelactis]